MGKGREGLFCSNGIVLNVLRGVQVARVWAFVEIHAVMTCAFH